MRILFAVAALAALVLAVHPSFAAEVADAGAVDAIVTVLAPSPTAAAPSFAVKVGAWLRAGEPPNWQYIAAMLWLLATALMKASSRLRANEPLELIANGLVRVPLVGQLARWWTTPGTVARTAGPPPISLLIMLVLLAAASCASYTAQQTRACVSASIAAAKDDVAAIRACLQTGGEHPPDAAITDCVETSATAALSDANAVLACMPEAPKP